MTYSIYDQNGMVINLKDDDYYYHLLKQTEKEIETLFLLRKRHLIRKDKKELRFQNRKNLRFLIYDFQEIKACNKPFFIRNRYLAIEYIRLIKKALYCKKYKDYSHFRKLECIWEMTQDELFKW